MTSDDQFMVLIKAISDLDQELRKVLLSWKNVRALNEKKSPFSEWILTMEHMILDIMLLLIFLLEDDSQSK